jgi:hypothetical protein
VDYKSICRCSDLLGYNLRYTFKSFLMLPSHLVLRILLISPLNTKLATYKINLLITKCNVKIIYKILIQTYDIKISTNN